MAYFIRREFRFGGYVYVVPDGRRVVVAVCCPLVSLSLSSPLFFFFSILFFTTFPHFNFIRAPQRVAGSRKKSTFGKSSLPRAKLAL